MNLLVSMVVQVLLLTYVGESTQIMAPLGGEMHLCDFAANLDNCPDGSGCLGPGGTKYTRNRLYGYTQWAIQKFVKQAFLDVHPDKEDVIKQHIDPGEYGMENHSCRLVCICLFVMSVVKEVFNCVNMARLLYTLPTDAGHWIRWRPEVKYKIGPIPISWKLFNVCFVLFPKIAIMHYVVRLGTSLLMDTPAIMDMILNSMSMTFILTIDETVFALFASQPSQHIMSFFGNGSVEVKGEEKHLDNTPAVVSKWYAFRAFFPKRAVVVAAVMSLYLFLYYRSKCTNQDGQWVSKDMYMPETSSYRVFDFVFDSVLHTVPRSHAPFWKMPEAAASE